MLKVALAVALPSLLISTAAFAEDTPALEETVCKKFQETGSLVKKRKVCLTKAQWNSIRSDAQNRTEEMRIQYQGRLEEGVPK